ncbi:MAG: hypothetical protein K940chlam7_00210 [Chlamydiae bacterium]|nr:hypothetical protein [Chlamydiota bacterium]
MKTFSLILLAGMVVCLSGCQMLNEVNCSSSAIQRNRCAVESSTRAIERNVEALERVTGNLEAMEAS